MPRGYRSALIAVGLALCASFAQSQDQPSPTLERKPVAEHGQEEGAAAGQQNSASEQEQPIDYAPVFKRIESAIRDLVSEEDQKARERQEQREISDLEAQQDMAFWTKGMFWASLAAVVVTFVGVVLVGFTLHHTKRAANYARDMVDEAKKTTDMALKTVQSERAWVSFSGIETFIDEYAIEFVVKWTNSGRSPALDSQIFIGSGVLNRGDEKIISFDRPQPKIIHRSTPLGPGMYKGMRVFRLDSQNSDLWTSGAIRVIIYSFVGYRDFYSDAPRHTEFCGEVEYIRKTVAPDGRLNIETYIHPHGRQNTGS